MRKISNLLQWIVILALAGWLGHLALRKAPPPDYNPDAWNAWDGFYALSYSGVGRAGAHEAYPSAAKLREHLTTLKNAGFETVFAEDIQAYLRGDRPLPKQALFLIFENGRKEAFIRATPILQDLGFVAHMAVPTHTMERKTGSFYLKPKDVRRVSRLPHWDFGSMGHKAIEDVPVDASGAKGRFMARAAWLGDRTEDQSEFAARIWDDFARSKRAMHEAMGRNPRFYLFPFSEAGSGSNAETYALDIVHDAVEQFFPLAFVGAYNPFNGPDADPRELTRLRAMGSWSGEELLNRLLAAGPRFAPYTTFSPHDWQADREAEASTTGLQLNANGLIWLLGTENWADIQTTARFHIKEGVFALYARYAGSRSYFRIAVTENGVRVQERIGSRLQTLAHLPKQITSTTPHELTLKLRANRAWVSIDDEPVGRALPLTGRTRMGRFGFGMDDGEAFVEEVHAEVMPSRYALAYSLAAFPEEERVLFSAILPNWFDAQTTPALDSMHRQEALSAAQEGVAVRPVINHADTLNGDQAVRFADTLQQIGRDPALRPFLHSLVLDGNAPELAEALRERGFEVAHLVPAVQVLPLATLLTTRALEEEILIRNADQDGRTALDELLHHWPADRTGLLTTNLSDTLPLGVHQLISKQPSSGSEVSP